MIRYYFDSQIFRYLNTDKQYDAVLLEVMESLREKVIMCYSDAHLDDLSASQQPYIDRDLEIMTRYVKDNFFSHDQIKKRTSCFLVEPIEAFHSKDYAKAKEYEANPLLVLDNLLKDAFIDDGDESGLGELFRTTVNSLFDLPIADYKSLTEKIPLDDEAQKMLSNLIPKKDILTIRDIAQQAFPYGSLIGNDKKEFSVLRNFTTKYLTEDISFESWGLDFDSKMANSSLGKDFISFVESSMSDSQKGDFYYKFNYAYTLLEIFGVDREQKKFTYKNLYNDACHAYYASYSDFLITNDKGLQAKAYILYSIFGIKTKVITMDDFKKMKSLLLSKEEDYETFTNTLVFDLESALQISEWKSLEKNSMIRTYLPQHHYFNYFNRLNVVNEEGRKQYVTLYCKRHEHANLYMYAEIELLTKKLMTLLGMDDDNKGAFLVEERDEKKNKFSDDEYIRRWTIKNLQFSLFTSSCYLALSVRPL